MVAVKIEDLKQRADEIVRQLRETGEPVQILDEEHVVARLMPTTEADKAALLAENEESPTQEELDEFWAEFDELSEEISAHWPEGVSAVDAIRDVR